MRPYVTIGLPIYNDSPTVLDAVRSVFAQTFTDWELIVVDDGSSDCAIERLRELSDSRIRLVECAENRGLAVRLNGIAQMARGTYLARMDGDDLMDPDRLSIQLAFLESHPEVDLLGTGMVSIDADGHPTGIRIPSARPMSPSEMLSHATLIHPSVMGKTSWFLMNPYDEEQRRAQDHELWVRTRDRAVIANIDMPYMFVREAGTITAAKYATSARATRRIIRRYGEDMVGRRGAAKLIVESYLKQFVYWGMERIDRVDWLVERRNDPLSETDRRWSEERISLIKSTHLPMAND